jgi:maltose alpha-D-glucosyltransferase/alpha-amylase
MNNAHSVLHGIWKELYPEAPVSLLQAFIEELDHFRAELAIAPLEAEWYKDAIVYSLYVDLFNSDFNGLKDKLGYLRDLGVNCLWLLPILDSPMRDAGFDISHYRRIRKDLAGLGENATDEETDRVFREFLDEAHRQGIRVIFDIATNHISDQHEWFRKALESKSSPFRDFFIWSATGREYPQARIIFEGIETSNWKKVGDEYFFHRFFDFQPDLNYRNPQVILEMSRNLLFWIERGVDGFRADAIPYIWKEEGTACENLPKTHTVVKFFRAVIDHVRPNMLLLAEACQKPHEVVRYFGQGDECNAGYHFPLMPMMFKALAMGNNLPVVSTLSPDVTPGIPENAQWFTFLRCHDELSLELVYVSEEDRKYIHESYCRKPEWDFRLGQGISARLSELMERDPARIGLIFSVMLSLPGTPVIYYGDEFGKHNDLDYYREMKEIIGKDDTRFLVRGKINWPATDAALADPDSYESKVNGRITSMIRARNQAGVFGRGSIEWLQLKSGENPATEVLSFIRGYRGKKVLIVQNLSGNAVTVSLTTNIRQTLLGENPVLDNGILALKPFEYFWFLI